MKLWPRTMAMRVAATLLLALASLVVLDFAVKRADARDQPARPTFPAPALPPPVRLTAVAGSIVLGADLAAVPPGAAPVVQVFTDGGYALRRPSPLPAGPAVVNSTAAIVLPTADFARLDARARATLVEILGALIAERPVSPDRFVTHGIAVERQQLARVLAWVR